MFPYSNKSIAKFVLGFHFIVFCSYLIMIISMYQNGDFSRFSWHERWSGNQYKDYDFKKYELDFLDKWQEKKTNLLISRRRSDVVSKSKRDSLKRDSLIVHFLLTVYIQDSLMNLQMEIDILSSVLNRSSNIIEILLVEFKVSFIPFGFEQDYYLERGIDCCFQARESFLEAGRIDSKALIIFFLRRLFSLSSWIILALYILSIIKNIRIIFK